MGTFSEIARPASSGTIEDLTTIFRPNHVIEVSMPVRGLTIRQEIIVVDCRQDQLIAHTSNISQFFANQSGQPVFIRTQAGDKILMAHLANLALPHGRLTLTDLKKLNHAWSDRHYERVQTSAPIFLQIPIGKTVYRGCLKDISHNGMSVTLSGPNRQLPEKAEGLRLTISLHIPPTLNAMLLRGEVVHIEPLTPCLTRMGIRFTTSRKNARLLDAYIKTRKGEILEEVKASLFEIWKNQETKDQYF